MKIMRIALLAFITLIVTVCTAFAQEEDPTKPPPRAPGIELDLVNGNVKDGNRVPFDVPIVFTGNKGTVQINKLFMFYGEGRCPFTSKTNLIADERNPTLAKFRMLTWDEQESHFGKTNISFVLSDPEFYFRPNRSYCLIVRNTKDRTVNDTKQQRFSLKTTASFSDYIKLDFGVGYAFGPKATIGVVTAHGYFTGVNNETNLADAIPIGRQIALRTSVFLGLAPVIIHTGVSQEIKKSTGLGNIVYGVGFRSPFFWPSKNKGNRDVGRIFLQPMRLNIGVLSYAQDDANILVTKNRNKSSLFLSMTFNFNISKLLGPIAKVFG